MPKASTEWRIDMWKAVLPSVPRYFFLGKGYGLDANDLYMSFESAYRQGEASATSQVAGDYHNGPLTLIIPLGIWGVIGFVWFWRCLAPDLVFLLQIWTFGTQNHKQFAVGFFCRKNNLFYFCFWVVLK